MAAVKATRNPPPRRFDCVLPRLGWFRRRSWINQEPPTGKLASSERERERCDAIVFLSLSLSLSLFPWRRMNGGGSGWMNESMNESMARQCDALFARWRWLTCSLSLSLSISFDSSSSSSSSSSYSSSFSFYLFTLSLCSRRRLAAFCVAPSIFETFFSFFISFLFSFSLRRYFCYLIRSEHDAVEIRHTRRLWSGSTGFFFFSFSLFLSFFFTGPVLSFGLDF